MRIIALTMDTMTPVNEALNTNNLVFVLFEVWVVYRHLNKR